MVKLFVEGGGDSSSLHIKCREAFNSFLQKAGFTGRMPRIVASGSRNDAYKNYCTAIKNGEEAVLLVDSESDVIIPSGGTYNADDPETWQPWYHLKNRKAPDGNAADNWNKPQGAADEDCHLMVQVMESWFLADIDAVKKYYGKNFNENCLPKNQDIEKIAKQTIINALENAASNTSKGKYNKGAHSFDILSEIESNKVIARSPWVGRFVSLLMKKMSY